MAEALLTVGGLSVFHGNIRAVDKVDLTAAPGEITALMGANGAGKSSLLEALIGLHRHATGHIRLGEDDLHGLPAHRRARLGVGYVPEGRRVFPGMTAEDNLLVASRDATAARGERAEDMYALFPQLGERRHAPAWQLSGGEAQMLAIARALMARPKLLLVDEPTLGLAPALTDSVMAALRAAADGGAAVLLAEQNARAALDTCDRAYLMRLGRIEMEGTPRDLAGDERFREIMMGG